jgi:hypothetical protein
MEPRHDEPQQPPKGAPKERFRLVKLETRIAPSGSGGNMHGNTCACGSVTCFCFYWNHPGCV